MNISVIISLVALTISGLTFWLTRIQKGKVKMTRPTIIFFGPDGGGQKHNKIYIRMLLYCTAERGQYIQNMFIRLQRGESVQNFNIWVYGDKQLSRGSGLFINKSGVTCDHHFLLPKDGNNYSFLGGEYFLQVYIETLKQRPIKIFEQKLYLTKEQEQEMLDKRAGLFFDWAPNTQNYFSHIDIKPLVDDDKISLLL